MSRILITGGAGFQGSHLAEYWTRTGHAVTVLNTLSTRAVEIASTVLDPLKVRVVWGSVTDEEVVHKAVAGQDVVAHLAAWTNPEATIKAPGASVQVNVIGTLRVLEAIRAQPTPPKLLYASSCEVYGSTVGDEPVKEDAPLRPHSPYAAGKAAGDRLCYAYGVTYGLPIVILRPCNVYGPRQRGGTFGAVIPRFVSAVVAEHPIMIRGDGSQSREWLYVDDLVRGYDRALWYLKDRSGGAPVFNLGSGEYVTVREIAEATVDILGGTIAQEPARPGEVRQSRLDSSDARRILEFEPRCRFWGTFPGLIQDEAARLVRRTVP